MNPNRVEFLGTLFFACAILHTFFAGSFQNQARRYPHRSALNRVFGILGEIEITFGLWAGILVFTAFWVTHAESAARLITDRDFTEPLFVFAIMTAAATRSVITATNRIVISFSRVLPLPQESAVLFSALTLGPLLGSLVTEPAAMTVTAFILRDRFFKASHSKRFKYMMLATLFVNVSIGGVLTHFAAPPVLLVSKVWHWDTLFMLCHFGWKAALACVANSAILVGLNRKELATIQTPPGRDSARPPGWLSILHLGLIAMIAIAAHSAALFLGLLLLLLILAGLTQKHQDPLKLKQSFLIAFFLAGLVVFGPLQSWWLKPLIAELSNAALFFGTACLTAFTDNAALTYLASSIPDLSAPLKYSVVAGAVAGGGLTVIANAPNPAGLSILRNSFGKEGFRPLQLFLWSLLPTSIALAAFWGLP